jgi:hypothetical protein
VEEWKMARKPVAVENIKPTVVATESPATNNSTNPFADFSLTTLAATKKYGTRMSHEDRRAKLIAALDHQANVVSPGYVCSKTKTGKDRKEAWVKGREGAFVFFVKYGHSELELAPGLKGVSIFKLSDALPVIARVKEVVKTGYFDMQIEDISRKLSDKIQKGKVEKAKSDNSTATNNQEQQEAA